MTITQGLSPQRDHSKVAPDQSVVSSIQSASQRLAYENQLNRWKDLLRFSAFLEDFETLGIRRGLHNCPGAFELFDKANSQLGAAMADCIAQLTRLEATR